MNDTCIYTIDELVQMTGTSRRTVRFYVQRGLIPPPAGRGGGHHYGKEHLAGIQRIQDLKRAGKSLRDIKAATLLAEDRPAQGHALDEATQRQSTRIPLGKDGIWLEVESGAAMPGPETIARLVEACRRELAAAPGGKRHCVTVTNRLSSWLSIPDGLGKGKSLQLDPGGSKEIDEVTPAIEKAEANGNVTVVKT